MKKSYFLISFVLLALCFSPALRTPFAHHDNVRFFDKFYSPQTNNPHLRDSQLDLAYLIGRPLTGEIQEIFYVHFSNLNELTYMRWVTVLAFAVCAGLLTNIFVSFGLGSLEALSLSVAIFILPGVQDAMIMLAIQNALAVWLALMAYLIACRLKNSGFENFVLFFCLMMTSFLLYPQWSFFVFVPILVQYLMSPPEKLRPMYMEFIRLVIFFSVTALCYFFYVKIFIAPHDARAGSYAFTIDLNFLYWKILDVFTKILPQAFNFWNIHTITWLGLSLMALTLVLLRSRASGFFLLLFWTMSFWLLARTDLILHRIFFVTSVMALSAFLISTRQKYTIVLAMTTGLLGVNYLMFQNVMNYNIEYSYIKESLLAHRQPFTRIHIVLPQDNGKGYNGQRTVDDTFNAKTALYNFDTDTLNLLRGALKENGVPTDWWVYSCSERLPKCLQQMPAGYHFLVTHSYKGQAIDYSPGMVLIDMNNL